MHVGEFPLFDVALDEPGLIGLFEEFDYEAGIVFHPDNALTRGIVERVPNAWALYWANPRQPGYAEEAAEFLDHPKFLGVKMHPLDDSAGERVVGVKDDPGLVFELLEQGHQPLLVEGDVEERELADVHVGVDDHGRHSRSGALPITRRDVRLFVDC